MINELSASSAIIVFTLVIGYKSFYKNKIHLNDVVMAAMAAGMLPLAFGLTLYPFYPSIIGSIDQWGLQITVTGLVLIFVYIKTIIEKLKSDSS